MPLYEYKCEKCGTKHEFLHKSINSESEVSCPNCKSKENKKLFSSFSASMGTSNNYSSCSSGNCDIPASSGCASGMCGLN
jgi:putative FmdB family regulatory protein